MSLVQSIRFYSSPREAPDKHFLSFFDECSAEWRRSRVRYNTTKKNLHHRLMIRPLEPSLFRFYDFLSLSGYQLAARDCEPLILFFGLLDWVMLSQKVFWQKETPLNWFLDNKAFSLSCRPSRDSSEKRNERQTAKVNETIQVVIIYAPVSLANRQGYDINSETTLFLNDYNGG